MFTGLIIIIFTIALLACSAHRHERDLIRQEEISVYCVAFNMIGWCLILLTIV